MRLEALFPAVRERCFAAGLGVVRYVKQDWDGASGDLVLIKTTAQGT